ncbi:MAG: Holliday junction branch migration protein RuvA [Alphaproteobacteria bacterium]|nr:Holliday junction branch migration protein RuvA [Alphaproteobacteria bacterium]MBV8548196.1 Holliday junction branch migration protein RuvA [Alphaproteobacteria bacterium]
MIGKLTGRIDSVSGSHLILDVNGVGYVVACSARTLAAAGRAGDALSLAIETHVREDAINLYGFVSHEEQDWFRLLTTVQGVGAKVALSILGILAHQELTNAIAAQDKAALSRADGVGPKLALRIVTELKDKAPSFAHAAAALPDGAGTTAPAAGGIAGDALSALINLGYKRAEAFGVVATLAREQPQITLDALIRQSLAALSKRDHAA